MCCMSGAGAKVDARRQGHFKEAGICHPFSPRRFRKGPREAASEERDAASRRVPFRYAAFVLSARRFRARRWRGDAARYFTSTICFEAVKEPAWRRYTVGPARQPVGLPLHAVRGRRHGLAVHERGDLAAKHVVHLKCDLGLFGDGELNRRARAHGVGVVPAQGKARGPLRGDRLQDRVARLRQAGAVGHRRG